MDPPGLPARALMDVPSDPIDQPPGPRIAFELHVVLPDPR
jgi:hypothetical protein